MAGNPTAVDPRDTYACDAQEPIVYVSYLNICVDRKRTLIKVAFFSYMYFIVLDSVGPGDIGSM